MSLAPLLSPSCLKCRSRTDLYTSNCKHLTLCLTCGKTMVKNRNSCFSCKLDVTRLIKEYVIKACSNNDKNYFIGKFVASLPNFSSSENQWALQKEGLPGRQVTDTLREYKNEAWVLEGEMRQSQYRGRPEVTENYFALIKQGNEFVAIPADFWYNFNKVAQCKEELSLEEAVEKMKKRRRNAVRYERWIMKAAKNGPAAFRQSNKVVHIETGKKSADKKGVVDDEE